MDGSFPSAIPSAADGRAGSALGVSTGQLIWAVATSVELVAVLLASEPVFRAVRLAGAAYLSGSASSPCARRSRGAGRGRPPRRRAGAWVRARPSFRASAGRWLRASRAQRAIEAVSGTVMIGLGVRVAADDR